MEQILPYLFFFAIFFGVANFDILGISLNQRSRYVLNAFLIFMLVTIAGFRWFDVSSLENIDGTWTTFDYATYADVYRNPLSLGTRFFEEYVGDISAAKMDIGYVYLSSFFCRLITNSPNIFFLFVSIVTVSFFIDSLKRNQIHSVILLILFIYFCRLYYQYNFIMMRQALSMAIVWWAIPFIHQKRFWIFCFCCVMAGFFHFTAFLFLGMYWLPKLQFSNKFLLYILPTLFICSITGITDRAILFTLQTILSAFGMDRMLVAYVEGELYAQGVNPLNFVELIPFLYWGIKYRYELCQTKNGKFFFNLLICYTLFMLVTMNFMALTRISSYYIYSFLFIFSYAYSRIKRIGNRLIVGYAFCFYFLLYGIRFIGANFSGYGYHLFFLN